MSYRLPLATTSGHGAVQVGSNLSITPNGILSASASGTTTYGYFFDTTLQTNPVIDTANAITFNSVGDSLGITNVAGSRITVSVSDVYLIVFTVSVNKTDGGRDVISVWLARNGANVPNSRQDLVINQNTDTIFTTGNYLLSLTAGDYVEMYWSSSDLSMRLLAEPALINPTRPVVPSARLTISQV